MARAARVDKSTVSRALNGTGRVAEDTRLRVLSAVETLGYRPSRLAQGFRTGSTATIGILVGALPEPGVAEFLAGVLEVAGPAGYSVLI
ncbi:MAG: LacI family DNA-binding transcriptional regulator, partial [Dehalococcoidia bacterium]